MKRNADSDLTLNCVLGRLKREHSLTMCPLSQHIVAVKFPSSFCRARGQLLLWDPKLKYFSPSPLHDVHTRNIPHVRMYVDLGTRDLTGSFFPPLVVLV